MPWPANMPAIPPIIATATIAATMPATASGDGRSPVSDADRDRNDRRHEAGHGRDDGHVAPRERDVEADDADAAGDAGRQSPPDRRDVGPSDSINGMITMHSANTTSSATSATAVAGERRLARPPT